MTCTTRAAIALMLITGPLRADQAGDFDYYVLSLSWSPGWCTREGAARGSEQCDDSRDLGWVLHGLWPQYETGWPDYCPPDVRPPSRSETAAMADIMGTGASAWHQWKQPGTCAGLSSEAYFAPARDASALLERPEVFVRTMTEKLLIYALGRGLDPADAPAVRAITGTAADDSYRLSSLILGVVQSTPFQMRRSQS